MQIVRELWSRLRGTARRGGADVELDEEVRFHLEQATRRNEARGMPADEARRAAIVAFGGVDRFKEDVREESRTPLLETLVSDVVYALRMLRKSPGFAAVAILTLALGIGANSAIFSVVNAVLLRPLPFPEGDRLVRVYTEFRGGLTFEKFWVSPPEYRGMQSEVAAFSSVGGWRTGSRSISGVDVPVRVTAAIATAELFPTLGVTAQIGRTYTPEEDRPNAPAVATISDRLWRSAFAGDPSILGRAVEVNGVPTTIVGVMPASFDLEEAGVDIWIPPQIPVDATNHGSHFLNVVARLAPGATPERASAEVQALATRWAHAGIGHLDPENHPVVLANFREEIIGNVRTPLLLLLGAVAFVLLIACANVANLMLSKAETRQREVAVRVAIGAGRRRLLRQFLTEGMTMAVIGGALGLFLGWAGLRALLAVSPGSIPRAAEISLDPRVLVFTLLITLGTGILFGLAPLLHLGERTVGSALREGSRRTTVSGARQRLRRLLVVSEIALAVVLAVGCGLLLRSLGSLQRVDLGFEPERLLTFQLFLPAARYDASSDVAATYVRIIDRVEALPGVASAALVSGMPPLRDLNANDTEFEGLTPTEDAPFNVDYYQIVDHGYFETMEIPIVEGRALTDRESPDALVLVVNETLARRYYPDGNALGRRIRPGLGPDAPWFTIVGIAKDVKQGGVAQPAGTEIYGSNTQLAALNAAQRTMYAVVRTERDPMDMLASIRGAIREVDPSLPLAEVRTMEENIAGAISRPRFLALLLSIFAALALTLAAIGTYGVMAYSVAQRRHEIGIRMAMGARRESVLGMVLRAGLVLAGIGLVAGISGAFALTRLMQSMLYGITATDPATFLAAPLVLTAVAVAACLVPAWRAMRLDPASVLREE